MWKSHFFLLVQLTISRIFLKGMEIFHWPSLIVTHTGIRISVNHDQNGGGNGKGGNWADSTGNSSGDPDLSGIKPGSPVLFPVESALLPPLPFLPLFWSWLWIKYKYFYLFFRSFTQSKFAWYSGLKQNTHFCEPRSKRWRKRKWG